jgi:hypothetical protein
MKMKVYGSTRFGSEFISHVICLHLRVSDGYCVDSKDT